MKRIWGIFPFLKRRKTGGERKGVIFLIDWENMFINLMRRKLEFSPDAVYRGFLELQEKIGQVTKEKIVGVYVFASSDSAIQPTWEEIFWKLGFPVISCPKTPEGDTVDEVLMREGGKLIRNMNLAYLCVATGDKHFIPLFKEANGLGLKIIAVYATNISFSLELLEPVDKIIDFPLPNSIE